MMENAAQKAYQVIQSAAWADESAPRRILAIRLQATGDVTICLPYLQALLRSLPHCELDFLTREECHAVPAGVLLFRQVLALSGGRSIKRQLARVIFHLPALRRQRYEVVLDLQNNLVSKVVRRLIRPCAWSAYDRYSPISAGERYRRTIEAAGFPLNHIEAGLILNEPDRVVPLLCGAGWEPDHELVILNPAGHFPSRNWPIENYAAFAEAWWRRRRVQFAILGLPELAPQAAFLRQALGLRLIDLVGKTTPAEALAVVQRARLVVSEDSGLMHMAWVSGVPTLALFGSSPHVWSGPLGSHTRCLHSGDLECGACMQATCRYGDVRCLTRYTPARIVEEAEMLLLQTDGRRPKLYGG